MTAVATALSLHIGAGAFWVLSSLAVAVTRHAGKRLVALQLAAGLIVVLAGAFLWHALHTGRDGSTEHILAVGTFCAFVGFGLQIGIAAPAMLGPTASTQRLNGGALTIYRIGALFIVLAAMAMVGSRYR